MCVIPLSRDVYISSGAETVALARDVYISVGTEMVGRKFVSLKRLEGCLCSNKRLLKELCVNLPGHIEALEGYADEAGDTFCSSIV